MNEPQKNFKDVGLDIKDSALIGGLSVSYNKVNKLITALYIVTDILDNDEPLRGKLRSSGVDILSDMYLLRTNRSSTVSYRVIGSILKTISFLDIASTVGILSIMNCDILRKEFIELKNAINHALENYTALSGEVNLADFFKAEASAGSLDFENKSITSIYHRQSDNIANKTFDRTRIGVQKGGNLMKAISDTIKDKNLIMSVKKDITAESFKNNSIKKERQEIILNIIKDKKDGLTITDIHNSSYGPLKDVGEKTLQRELASMVEVGVLKKTGAKRWSRYFVNSSSLL